MSDTNLLILGGVALLGLVVIHYYSLPATGSLQTVSPTVFTNAPPVTDSAGYTLPAGTYGPSFSKGLS